jgi:Tfp pilus assembly protein PilX
VHVRAVHVVCMVVSVVVMVVTIALGLVTVAPMRVSSGVTRVTRVVRARPGADRECEHGRAQDCECACAS